MGAQPDSGDQLCWLNGLPAPGIKLVANDIGTNKFWFDGLPEGFIYPLGPSGASNISLLTNVNRRRRRLGIKSMQ